MYVVGLTGSIASGKTTTSRLFSQLGVPVFNADTAIHELYSANGEAVPIIEQIFPDAITNGSVDRDKLSRIVFGQPELLAQLEAAVHPLLIKKRNQLLKTACRHKKSYVVLDIPLLFETGLNNICDMTVVVSVSEIIQKQRALSRPGMTFEKLTYVLSRQMPDFVKRNLADTIILTGCGYLPVVRAVQAIDRLARKKSATGQCWQLGGLRSQPQNGIKQFFLRG